MPKPRPPLPGQRKFPAGQGHGAPDDASKRKRGFQVGPKLGKGVYQGHAKKIKDTLIHKAKVKKAYAKTLEREGYGGNSTSAKKGKGPQASGANSGALGGERRMAVQNGEQDEEEEGTAAGLPTEAEREMERARLRKRLRDEMGDDDDDDDVDQGGDDDDSEEETGRGRGGRRRERGRRASSSPLPEERNQDEDQSDSEVTAAQAPNLQPQPPSAAKRQPLGSPSPPPFTNFQAGRRPKQARQAQPPRVTAPPPKAAKRPRLTEHELEELRAKKAAEKRRMGERHGRTGQPKLGNRVEQLLGRIQRSMQ